MYGLDLVIPNLIIQPIMEVIATTTPFILLCITDRITVIEDTMAVIEVTGTATGDMVATEVMVTDTMVATEAMGTADTMVATEATAMDTVVAMAAGMVVMADMVATIVK